MEHHFVQRVSRLFPSSFTSCQFRAVPDVVESSIPITKILHHNIYTNINPIKKKTLPHSGSDNEGRKCPPVTPVSILPPPPPPPPTTKEPTKSGSSNSNSTSTAGWFTSTSSDTDIIDEEEREESDPFFSLLLSTSSNSSESSRLKIDNKNHQHQLGRCSSGISAKSANSSTTTYKTTSKNPPPRPAEGILQHTQESQILNGCKVVESSTQLYYGNTLKMTAKKIRRSRNSRPPPQPAAAGRGGGTRIEEESYAVEKTSDDPRGDFRTSMLEMIIEKQIFCAEDLERLLFCFLSLNSPHYHRIIVEEFTLICDTLFSN